MFPKQVRMHAFKLNIAQYVLFIIEEFSKTDLDESKDS
jgi:hypothetical protein